MANGLRTILRKAQRQDMAILARRNRFAGRLNVEELEDRIAPALVQVAFDGDSGNDTILAWTTDGTGDWADGTSGIAFFGGNSTLDVAFTPTATSMGNLTITNGTSVDATEILYLSTNASIGTLDFSGLNATTTTLTLVIHAGVNYVGGGGTGWTEAEIAGTIAHAAFAPAAASGDAFVIASDTTVFTNVAGAAPTDTANPAVIGSGIGAITLPSTVTALNIVVYGGDTVSTGAIGAISATGANVTTGSRALGATVASVSVASTAGTVTLGAVTGALTATGNVATVDVESLGSATVGGNLTSLTSATGNIGAVTVTGDLGAIDSAGTLGAISADTIGTIVSNGNIASIATTGAGTAAGSTGTGAITSITTNNGNIGALTTSDGAAGTTLADITGAVNLGTGNITGAWSVDGSIDGAITAGAVNGVVTAATGFGSTIGVDSIATAGGFTATTGNYAGGITIATNLNGAITATDGNVGAVTTTAGDLAATGSIAASGNVGVVTIGGAWAGNVIAGGNVADIAVTGNLTGGLTAGGNLTNSGAVGGNMTGTIAVGDASDDVFAGLVVTGNLTGELNVTGDVTGAISAADITGPIVVTGNLKHDVTATAGDIASLTVAGLVSGASNAVTISATGGSVTLTAGGILGGGNAVGITATENVTVAVNGTNYGGTVNGKINGTAGAITMTADSDTTDGGNLVVTSSYIWTEGAGITLAGDNVTVTMNTRPTAADTDVNSLTAITAANDVTINAVTGDLTVSGAVTATAGNVAAVSTTGDLAVGTLTATAGNVAAVTSGGTLAITTLTAPAGTVGAITAGDDLAIATLTAESIGAVTADGAITAGAWTASDGAMGAVTAEGLLTINTKIESTTGTVGVITSNAAIAGNGNIIAGAQTADAEGVVLKVVEGDIVYTIETTPETTATFAVDFETAGTNEADIEITKTTTGAINLALKTAEMTSEGAVVNDQYFNLTDLAFKTGTSAANRTLGVVTVDGSTLGNINLGTGSQVGAFIVQDNLGGQLIVDKLNLLAAAQIDSTPPTANLADAYTRTVADLSNVAAAAANGTFVIPIDPANPVQVFAATGATGFFANTDFVQVGLGAATDAEITITFVDGAFGSLSGEAGGLTLTGDISVDQDFSNITGTIAITGSVADGATLTLGDLTDLTITGPVAGTLTVGDLAGNLVLDAVSGTVTVGDVAGALTLDAVSGSFTAGDVAGAVLVDAVAADGVVTINDFGAGLTVTNDMAGSLIVGDGGDLMIGGAVSSYIQVGIIANLLVGGDLGATAGSSVVAGDFIGAIVVGDTDFDGVVDSDADMNATLFLLGQGGAGAILIDATQGYVNGALYLGIETGIGGLQIITAGDNDTLTIPNGTYVNVAAGSFAQDAPGTFDLLVVTADGAIDATDNDGLAADQSNIGAIIIGVDFSSDIDVEGDLGTLTIDNDADVAATFDLDGIFTTLIAGLTVAEQASAQPFLTALADAYSAVQGAFFDANGVDTMKDYQGNYADYFGGVADITAFSIGGIVVEGNVNIDDITVTKGAIGDITAGGDFFFGDLLVTYHADGGLGLITAGAFIADANGEGDIVGDITVEKGDFQGMISQWGGYAGSLQILDGSVTTILLSVDSSAQLTNDDFFPTPTGLSNIDLPGHFAFEGFDYDGADVSMTVTGPTALAVYNAAGDLITVMGNAATATFVEVLANALDDITFLDGLAGTVTVTDETGIGDFIVEEGNLSGTVTVSSSVFNLYINQGNFSGAFTANGDMNDLSIDGDWTGTLTLLPVPADLANGFWTAAQDGEILGQIVVSGSVANAILVGGFDATNVWDADGNPLAQQVVTFIGGAVPQQVGASDQYVYVKGAKTLNVEMRVLFGQVTGLAITGKGSAQIVSVESAAALTAAEANKALSYGQKMIKGNESANAFIDFDNPGAANLPVLVVAPRVSVASVVVDGDFGGIVNYASNLKNVFVSGNSGDLIVGGSITNAYIGGVANDVVAGGSITNAQFNIAGDVKAAKTIKSLVVENNMGDLWATKINNAFIQGNVVDIYANNIKGLSVMNDANSLTMTGQKAAISNSMIADSFGGFATNFHYNNWDDTNVIDNQLNAVKIKNTILPSLV